MHDALSARLFNCLLFVEAGAEWWQRVLALGKKDVEPNPTISAATSWVSVDGAKTT